MSIFSSLSSTFSTPNATQTAHKPNTDAVRSGGQLHLNNIYAPDNQSWYTAKPYGFKLTQRGTNNEFTMFLPISPSNLTVSTSFATNIVPTLYGTVEEHSDIRYYDIVIEGTTGMAPKFVNPSNTANGSGNASPDKAYQDLLQPGRAMYPIATGAALGCFFSNTIAQISNILNQAKKAVGTITGSNQLPLETAIYTNQTGYIAFHNLYRFLLKYKKDAAGVESQAVRTTHPLTFFNYKDGVEYDVAIRNFTLRRSAENPMLYYYSIVMRGYNIRSSGSLKVTDDLNTRLVDLGLNGVKSSSLLSSIKSVSDSAKAIVGSAINGVNLFGR